MQAFNMSNNLAHRGPAPEIETQQLKRAFAWGAADPQTNEATSNQRHVDLQLDAILTVSFWEGGSPHLQVTPSGGVRYDRGQAYLPSSGPECL